MRKTLRILSIVMAVLFSFALPASAAPMTEVDADTIAALKEYLSGAFDQALYMASEDYLYDARGYELPFFDIGEAIPETLAYRYLYFDTVSGSDRYPEYEITMSNGQPAWVLPYDKAMEIIDGKFATHSDMVDYFASLYTRADGDLFVHNYDSTAQTLTVFQEGQQGCGFIHDETRFYSDGSYVYVDGVYLNWSSTGIYNDREVYYIPGHNDIPSGEPIPYRIIYHVQYVFEQTESGLRLAALRNMGNPKTADSFAPIAVAALLFSAMGLAVLSKKRFVG